MGLTSAEKTWVINNWFNEDITENQRTRLDELKRRMKKKKWILKLKDWYDSGYLLAKPLRLKGDYEGDEEDDRVDLILEQHGFNPEEVTGAGA
jgi:hypothetical protein